MSKYRVYVIAIEDTQEAFDAVIPNTNSWAEITDDSVTFEKAEAIVGNVENIAYHAVEVE